MTKIHFLRDFDYRQDEHLTIAYMAGMEAYVDEDCAALALATGAAESSDFAEDDLIEGRHTDFEDDQD